MKFHSTFLFGTSLVSFFHFAQANDFSSSLNAELAPSVLIHTSELERYQSGFSLTPSFLKSNALGNIGSMLKVLPNVQFDNAHFTSNTPGEIDTANISVSGGLFYQNNFTLDGFTMNNDLDPIGSSVAGVGGASQGLRAAKSQGFNIDTSFLETLSVQDSNIGAKYGGFSGGLIEATIRKPRKDGFYSSISYQYTADSLTQYHIDESLQEDFLTSSNENYQPKFSKHLIKGSFEGYINENLGFIGLFSTTRSFIPLNAYSNAFRRNNLNTKNVKRKQTRRSDNYYFKTYSALGENVNLETNLGFMPQYNSYYSNITKDSFYTMKTGGLQSGIKGLWENEFGLLSNALSYSFLQNSRKSEKNYWLAWRYSLDDKNWAASGSGKNLYVSEGGVSDVEQKQATLSYKSDMLFNPLWKIHTFRIGLELAYSNVARNIRKEYYYSASPSISTFLGNLNAQECQGDIFGLSLCSTATTSNNYKGQFIKRLNVISPQQTKLDTLSYGVYFEDELQWKMKHFGEASARLGVRLDGDDYMQKKTLAPRFSLSYTFPHKINTSRLIFGANRYYGRNLFSYRLYDSSLAPTKQYNRTSINSQWVKSDMQYRSNFKFNQLKVPYSDELMLGFTQELWLFEFALKYIYRQGKDEILRRQRNSTNAPPLDNYSNSYTFYTNDGKSRSDIITLIMTNKPFDTFGVKHFYLLAFDFSNIKRSYNLFSNDEAYYDNTLILYDGKIMPYRDRPTENYAQPFTLRLNTSHYFYVGRQKYLWSNFFRYRSGYERMVRLNANHPNYVSSFSGDQYGKMKIKGAFTWDMRLGFEFLFTRKNTFFANIDVYNVLNSKNVITLNRAGLRGIASSSAVSVYELGRQFWLQIGVNF